MLCSHLQGEHPKNLHKSATKQPRIPRVAAHPLCAVTPKENPPRMNTQDGFRKGRTAIRGILKGKAVKRSPDAEPLAPYSSSSSSGSSALW